jgi:signal transduction histidine kinase
MPSEVEGQVSGLKQGDHVCPIYENVAEQMAVAIPFLKEGLRRRERCLYVADDRSVDQITQALHSSGVDVAHEQARGALRILTHRESYLASDDEFDPQAMIEFLRQAEGQAIADGFSGLRVLGEMTWALGPKLTGHRLIEYEALVNKFLQNSRTVILCQYNRPRFDPAVIHDVLRTHPTMILGAQVCPNPYYEPPELVLSGDPMTSRAFKAKRVDWWIMQLKRARAVALEREAMIEHVQTLSRRLLEVQEAERRNLARELHDEIGQLLTGLGLLLKPDGNPSSLPPPVTVEHMRVIIQELLERIRGLSFDLRPAALDEHGVVPALLALFERYTSQTGIVVDFKQQGMARRFPPEVETAAYRTVQEALTNVARHARAAEATVRVWATVDILSVQVEDRGRGFDAEAVLQATRSGGLVGMRERLTLLGGHLTVDSWPGGGTRILAEIALPTSG